jgi:MtfA peptidase
MSEDKFVPLEWLDARSATFPAEWREVLLEQVPFYRGLRGAALQRFENKLKIFVYTKTFSSRQIAVTEEMKVVVAAAACRLTMNLPWEDYARLRHVSVHASEFTNDDDTRVIGTGGSSKVAISWVDLVRGFAGTEDGNNVGYHEFAHALDGADGSLDGEAQGPPSDLYQVWTDVIASARAEVERALAANVDPPIDAYAATDDAEFFAVATEWFFERPRDLRATLPTVYDLLCRFYRQDPVADDAPAAGTDRFDCRSDQAFDLTPRCK